MVRVAVDALGGDNAPAEIVAGATSAASASLRPVLYGPSVLETNGLELVVAPDSIGMDEHPVDAVRGKPASSLVRAVQAVADGQADTVVSAGSTGAMLAAALLHIHRLPGVHRPGIAVVLPARSGPSVLIDSGANAEARPEHLLQFAHMGAVFAHEILGIRDPRVRLLSIGEEDGKGDQLTLEAHALLRESGLRFEGNTESRWLLEGTADVVVTDGFTGNVALKAVEGTIRSVLGGLREELTSSLHGRVAGLLMRSAARNLRRRLDPDAHGGAYLLGLRGLVVIAHGSSSRVAVRNAIELAARGVEHRIVDRLAQRLGAVAPAARA
jgi:phosphate acyltransferase